MREFIAENPSVAKPIAAGLGDGCGSRGQGLVMHRSVGYPLPSVKMAMRVGLPTLLYCALGACSSGGGSAAAGLNGEGEREQAETWFGPNAAEALLNDRVSLDGEGELLSEPDTDDSVEISSFVEDPSGASQMAVAPGDVITVTLMFEAPEGNVAGGAIRFGSEGEIHTKSLPELEGLTSGTLSFEITIPDDLCAELGEVCHSVLCYEYALTTDGRVSRANVRDVVTRCGQGCAEPSCGALLPECLPPEQRPLYYSDDLLQDLEADATHLYWSTALLASNGGVFRAPKDGSAKPSRIYDFGAENLVVAGEYVYAGTFGDVVKMGKDGSDPVTIGDSIGDEIAGDGENVYVVPQLDLFCDGESAPVTVIRPDGSGAELTGARSCPITVATGGGRVYWLEGEELFAVYSVPAEGGTAEQVVAPMALGKELVIGDRFVYLVGTDETSGVIYRAPIAGGSVEEIGSLYDPKPFWDGKDLYVVGSDFGSPQLWRWNEAAREFVAIADPGQFAMGIAADSEWVYIAGADRIVRVAK